MATKAKSKKTAAGRPKSKGVTRSSRPNLARASQPPRFTRREAALFAEVPLRSVDKAIEERVIKPRRVRRAPVLDSGDVLAIALLARARLPLSAKAKREVNRWVHGIVEDSADQLAELLLSEVLVLRYDETARELAARLSEYFENRERFIASDPEVMGGEAVIAGTRIPVRAVAARLDGGELLSDLREDYPGVSRAAFEAARTYAKAHPRRGRPARPWRDG